ncbi:MAG: TIGR02099 family protein [Gammaproteobacteria bacterium]|nr:TIGR02099 family protein [Gammaproteobacteria bacterium]
MVRRWLKLAWAGFAILTLTSALGLSALRVVLANLEPERPRIERWLSDYLGAPITIGRVATAWRRGLPVITGYDIRVNEPMARAVEALHFDAAEATIAPFSSLRKRHVELAGLVLSGVRMAIERAPDGHFSVRGFHAGNAQFAQWLMHQQRLTVAKADVVVTDQRGIFAPLKINAATLAITRDRARTTVRGTTARLDPLAAAIDFELQLPQQADAPFELRVASPALDVAAAAHALIPRIAPPQPLVGALKLALQWSAFAPLQFVFALESPTSMVAPSPTAKRSTVMARGAGTWQANALALNVTEFAVDTSPAPLDWRVHYAPATHRFRLSADRMPLAAVKLIADWLPPDWLPAPARSAVPNASGELRDLRVGVDHAAAAMWYASGQVDALALSTALGSDLTGLTARFAVNTSGGAINAVNAEFVVHHPRLVAPLTVSALTGALRWTTATDASLHSSLDLAAMVNDFPLQLAGSIEHSGDTSPLVDLEVSLGTGDLTRFNEFMPREVMHPHGDHWLRTAFVGGVLKSGRLTLRGPLDAFPFDHDGLFSADFTVEDVELRYSEHWPLATDVDSTLAFRGRHLSGELTQALFFDSPLRQAHYSIADIFSLEPILLVNGTVRATLTDALHVLRESPLHGALTELADLEIDGPFDLTLDMNLGLHVGGKTSVLGQIAFDGNTLRSARHHVAIDDLKGNLSFTHDAWHGAALTANYRGEHVGLRVSGGIGDPSHDSEFRMTGTSNATQLLGHLKHYAPYVHHWLAINRKLDALRGAAPWQAVLTVPHAPERPQQLVLESTLVGLAVGLPWPFGKSANDRLPLRIEATLGAPDAHTTQLALGDTLHLMLEQIPTAGGSQVSRVDVALGPNAPALTHDGLYVHGDLNTLPLGEWAALMRDATLPTLSLPMAFDIKVANLHTLGQDFDHVALNGHRDAVAWRVHVDSARAAGDVTIPADLAQAPLTLNFDRLWLAPVKSDDGQSAVDPRRMPALAMACASFKYHDIDLGQAAFATQRLADGLDLQSLLFQNPAFQMHATGRWTVAGANHQSQFTIGLKGEALGPILQHFGYNAQAIDGGETQLDIEAAWHGTPADFTLDRLDGKLNLRVGKGRLLDIEPGSGRLFGLLSLQTLPRRLSFDFADLFEKGFVFDHIEGWFELQQGNAYTNSLYMEGPSAKVEISGRTGLAQQDYDQLAVVTPSLSKSIPLASAFFGPAGIGVGAAIYLGQKVFKSIPEQVDKFLQKRYSITGGWTNPKVERL